MNNEFAELKKAVVEQSNMIRPYCGPVFFTSSLGSAIGTIPANGSFGLVDAGEKKLLVTCYHVWDAFEKLHGANPELRMLVCLDENAPVVVDPRHFIDQNEQLDIATFDMAALLERCGGRKFYELNQNPAPSVAKGDSLFFVGYPGWFRSANEEGVQFGRLCFRMGVSDVSGFFFIADVSKTVGFDGDWKRAVYPDEKAYPGISGSPCFLRQGRDVRLVGFTTSVVLDFLRFTHVHCLNTDGTIKKLRC